MIDINLLRTNPDLVRENIKKKFQDVKLPLVDEVIELDKANRAAMTEADGLRNKRKVTVDTSLRLGKYFGVSDRYFIDLQNGIDIRNRKR